MIPLVNLIVDHITASLEREILGTLVDTSVPTSQQLTKFVRDVQSIVEEVQQQFGGDEATGVTQKE